MTTPPTTGPLILPSRLGYAEALSRLYITNPFVPAWTDLHKAALGERYVPGDHASLTLAGAPSANRRDIAEKIALLVGAASRHLAAGGTATPRELAIYQGLVIYSLWDDFGPELQRIIDEDRIDAPFYDDFAERYRATLGFPGLTVPEPGRLFAFFYQARRAWYFARTKILGGSPSAAAARAAIWRAIMGGDVRTYASDLYLRMHRTPVLITGETGTGKELAAECIGWSRYIPFDVAPRRFAFRHAERHHARNLCETPPELLPSALFGHKRGSFTGATSDMTGFFALPLPGGSLQLDEFGELPLHVQAQLLRPLEGRQYLPIGETRLRPIECLLIFTTNRDLEAMCREGTFRPDLHERMKGVHIHMPSLLQMLREAPGEMRVHVMAFVAGEISSAAEVEAMTDRIMNAIGATGASYGWSRNVRELKNFVVSYVINDGQVVEPWGPAPASSQASPVADESGPESSCPPSSGILGPRAKAGEVSLDELTRAFVVQVHVLTGGSLRETARRTSLDYRTVKRYLDPACPVRSLPGKR
jgi:two-component system, NtrC family, response regulator HydG